MTIIRIAAVNRGDEFNGCSEVGAWVCYSKVKY